MKYYNKSGKFSRAINNWIYDRPGIRKRLVNLRRGFEEVYRILNKCE